MFRTVSIPRRPRSGALGAISAVALLSAAACAPYHQTPQEEARSNPTVTYKYAGDQELVAADQQAMTYCTRYNATRQTVSITENTDGTKSVTFECVPSTLVSTPQPAPAPNLSYTITTDQDLLRATQAANNYCLNQGRRAVTSSISPSGVGTRTVTFQCVPA